MFTRLSAKLLLVLMFIILTACSLTSNANVENRVTAVPTDLVVNTPLIATQTPFSETVNQPTPTTSVAIEGPTVFPRQCLSPADWVAYRVVAGDTLAAIARRTGTTTAQLAAGNCLSDPSAIEEGQLLYIPPTH
jgi:LysM repeat protein